MTAMDEISTLDTGPSFLDPAINANPFPSYDYALAERPIYFDPAVGFFIVSRYEDIRRILTDPVSFSSEEWLDTARTSARAQHARRIADRFAEKGWTIRPNMGMLDDPRHREIRKIFDAAFRPARVKEMENSIGDIAVELVDAFPKDGRCELVAAYSVPLPLRVIGRQVGARSEDMPQIKLWMDALIDRAGFMLSPDEEMLAVDKVIEAQHYFKKVIDGLRGRNDGTVLGDLVNIPLSDGDTMTDEELLSNLMDGIFLAGTETTTNSISAGVRMLCEQDGLFARLKSDPDKYLRTFIEEVLRLESPAQGLFRVSTVETEVQGVRLPAGSILHLRVGAANRDERQFGCPARVDLERKNAGAHLAFGSGIHHCVGAPLARRELHWAFSTLLNRFSGVRLAPEQAEVEYLRNYMFRAIRRLHVEFLQ